MAVTSNGTTDRTITTGTIPAMTNYSYAFWFQSPNAPANASPIRVAFAMESAGNAFDAAFIWQYNNASKYQAAQHFLGGGSYAFAQIATALSANTWYHIAVTYDGTNLKIYLNGSLEATTAAAPQTSAAPKVAHFIYDVANPFPLDGTMAEAAVWNDALTAADVAVLANAWSPDRVRPDKLVYCNHLLRYPGQDVKGNAITVTGTTVSDHPRVYYEPHTQEVWPALEEVRITFDVTLTIGMSMGFSKQLALDLTGKLNIGTFTRNADVYVTVEESLSLNTQVKSYSAYLATGRTPIKPGGY